MTTREAEAVMRAEQGAWGRARWGDVPQEDGLTEAAQAAGRGGAGRPGSFAGSLSPRFSLELAGHQL